MVVHVLGNNQGIGLGWGSFSLTLHLFYCTRSDFVATHQDSQFQVKFFLYFKLVAAFARTIPI